MNLTKSAIVAVVAALIGTVAWEFFWRSEGYSPDLDGNKDLWAVQRQKLHSLNQNDYVFMGSSRIMFDLQLDAWESETGKRPLQLGIEGSSPLPVFRDLVEHSDFNGTAVIGVSPGLFFYSTDPETFPWNRSKSMIDHYHKRTWAQRLNHTLSLPLQQHLAFMTEDDGVDGRRLRELLNKIKWGDRVIDPYPPFPQFATISVDRNVRMFDRAETDTGLTNAIKKVWTFPYEDEKPPAKDSVIAHFAQTVQKFVSRGGKVIMIRFPSDGEVKKTEDSILPRASSWDELLKRSGVRGYYFEDYPELNRFRCPEWSHLSARDADSFTIALARILKRDGLISFTKTP